VTRFVRVATIVCVLQTTIATSLFAQGILQQPQLPDPEAIGRFRLGFIRFTPSIVLTNLGVDTNVFNELVDPKDDFTVMVGPKAEFWSRLGSRGRIYGSAGLDYQYFQEFDSQRSFGTADTVRLDVDLGRLTPFVDGAYTNTRIRPGFEIDTRARREDLSGRVGVSLRVQSKTKLLGWLREERFRYAAGEEFLATDLSRALDRDSTYYGGGIQVELTPLTTFLTDVEIGEDRFVRSSERDADTWKVMPGFKFKPFALIDGGLAVGYRKFQTLNRLVPDFGGVIALVDLGYTLRATRVSGRYNRDVTYSYETVEPYYLQTDWSVAVVQKITTAWDVAGRVGRYKLDYETVGLPGAERRSDSGNRYGGGIGYSLGQYVRLGFDVNYIDRQSDASITRNYEGVRAGLTVTYGTKQR
jgi:hypothetical protein